MSALCFLIEVPVIAVGLGYLSVRMIVHKCLVAPIKVVWIVACLPDTFSATGYRMSLKTTA